MHLVFDSLQIDGEKDGGAASRQFNDKIIK
jgi:hypothetical protein